MNYEFHQILDLPWRLRRENILIYLLNRSLKSKDLFSCLKNKQGPRYGGLFLNEVVRNASRGSQRVCRSYLGSAEAMNRCAGMAKRRSSKAFRRKHEGFEVGVVIRLRRCSRSSFNAGHCKKR